MRDPDVASALVKAWHMNIPNDPRSASNVDTWLVNGPYHPFWSWWMVCCVDLDEHEGVDPPKKQFPTAEYEFIILSLNPEHEVDIDEIEAGKNQVKFLTPPDCVVQFGGIKRAAAKSLVADAVAAIVVGRSPDSDFRGWWETAILRGAEHIRTGGHEAEMAQA